MNPRPSRADRGSAAVEIVILTPVLIMLLLFVVYVGRAGGASQQVRHAADAGARAASLVARASMSAAAANAANDDLDSNGANCASTSVSLSFADGPSVDSVTVTVSCVVSTDGTGLLGAAARTVSASSTEVVDRYRAG